MKTPLHELTDGCGAILAGLASVHAADLTKIYDSELSTAMELLQAQLRLAEKARLKILEELTDRARVRAMRASTEEAA